MSQPRIDRILRFSVLPIALAGAFVWAQDDASDFQIEYSGSSDAVVIEYDVESAIAKVDDTPLLRIYGDGRVHVHRQPYREGAGDFEMKLSEDQVAGLLKLMHDNGAMTYDAKSVEQALHAAKAARANAARTGGGVLTDRSDVELTVIRIQLDAYKPSATAALQTGFNKEIRCADLQHKAVEFAQISAFAGLANAENALQAIANNAQLRSVGGAQ